MSAAEIADIQDANHDSVDAVIVGLDTDFNYRKLSLATYHLRRNPGVPLIATNEDAFDVVADNRYQPGNGCLVKSIELASGKKAINVGKPSSFLIGLISDEHGFLPEKAIMIGDRMDTDIKFGVDGGLSTCGVLTGVIEANTLLESSVYQKDLNEDKQKRSLPNVVLPYVGLPFDNKNSSV